MSNRDMSEEVYSSSDDEKYFDEDINYSQYPDRDAEFNIQSTTTKHSNSKRPFSLPYESTHVGPDGVNFTIFNNKDTESINAGGKKDKKDLKVNIQERRRVKLVDDGIPRGEAFSSQGTKYQARLTTQNAIAQSNNKISINDLFRRREYIEDPKGGDSGKSYYSQRRKMIAIPTNLGKDKVDHTLLDGTTEKLNHKGIVNDDRVCSNNTTAHEQTRNTDRAHRYEKSNMKYPRTKTDGENLSNPEKNQKDVLGMTEAVDQRAEAFLVGKFTRTRNYGTPGQTTSVMSKKREQSKQPSPFNNRAVRDNPSSASEGKYLDKHTTHHPYWYNNRDEDLKDTSAAENLESQVMKDYRKTIDNLDRESKKRTEELNRLGDGVGENRIDVLDIIATEKTPVYLINLSRDLFKSLDISKMEILLALSNQMNIRLDWATDSLRDLSKERWMETEEAIELVTETLTLYERNKNIIGILNGEEKFKTGIAQHRGVLNELMMMKENRRFKRSWIPTTTDKAQKLFQW